TFTLEIFDGDLGGFWDGHDLAKTGVVRVNYVLYADPLKNGQGTLAVASRTEADFSDDAWGTLYSGPVHDAARAPSGNYFYRLQVSFADPAAAANEINGFKIRADGQLSVIPGAFGFVGAPINVDLLTGRADPGLGTARNQYNGEWHWYVYAPAAGSVVTISDTDADARTTLTRPGNPPDDCSAGATCFAIAPDIRYEVLLGGSPVLNVTSPSGDLETASRSLTTSQAGFLDWHWTGVDGHNLVFISSSHELSAGAETPLPVSTPPPEEKSFHSTIRGRVYADTDCNGMAGAGEGGVEGVVVTIDSGGGWSARTNTGPDGSYDFGGLSQGRFFLHPAIPAGYDRANPASRDGIAVDGDVRTIVGGADFGLATLSACAAPAPIPAAPVEEGPAGTSRTWYMAEGNTGTGFETRLLITNPGPEAARATITLFPEVGRPVSVTYEVSPASTREVVANQLLPDSALGVVVEADQPVTVERSMSFMEGARHKGTGSPRLAGSWQVPGIETAGGAESWVLLLNPHARPASVVLTFVRADGDTVEQGLVLPPQSRLTIFANSIVPETTGSARVKSDLPVVVERSTYRNGVRQGENAVAVPVLAKD
ncbi:MAG: hypothetical protein HY673_04065, partial [Chloroflexi bacterium]|nr:hypothetical protein [Chloroflexota bacterium]